MRMSQVFVLALRLCRLLCGKPMASRPQSALSVRSGRAGPCRTTRFKEPAPRNGTAIPHRKRRSRGTCSPVSGEASLVIRCLEWWDGCSVGEGPPLQEAILRFPSPVLLRAIAVDRARRSNPGSPGVDRACRAQQFLRRGARRSHPRCEAWRHGVRSSAWCGRP
jgi:hypothetical protein